MHHEDSNQIKDNGWRQGCVLPKSLVERLVQEQGLQAAAENQFYIVISHDCDVTNPSLKVEPLVELLKASLLHPADQEGSRAWGKNPRFYQLECESHAGQCFCQLSIHDRISVPREYFATACPDTTTVFDPDDIRALALWIARRYVRSAFPDAFVERTKPATDRLRKKLRKQGNLLTAIYVVVVEEELPEDRPYEIILHGSMRVDDYGVPERRESVQELLDKVEAALADCDGIEVKESCLKSEKEISIDDRRILKRWDFDDLTIRGQAISELPPID